MSGALRAARRYGEDDRIAQPLEHEPHLAVDLARQGDLAQVDPDRGKERTKRFGTPDTVDERRTVSCSEGVRLVRNIATK